MKNNLSFEAKDKKLKDILFGNLNYSLKIPRYQRPYAWKEEQISEFWNDINNQDQTYFLGSFIFNKQFEDKGYIEVIDGQQRLLTTTIFISALREHSSILKDNKLPGILQRQCIAFEDEDGNHTFRVIPGDSTKKYYEKFVQNLDSDIINSAPKTKEEQIIKKNFINIFERIALLINQFDSKEDKINKLKELRKKIGNLIVIDIQIKSEDVAYEIFETVNARGVELSVSDLLKNLIFSKIKGTESKDIAKEMWTDIESNVEQTGTDLKKFIRYYWISKYSFVTEKKLYTSIKREINDWEEFINDLYDASNWYNLMLEGNESDFSNIKNGYKIYRSLFAIKLMNVSQCYVFYLSILKNIDKMKTDPYKTIQLIEKFTYQYSAICKLPGNRVEKIYSKYAREIETTIKDNLNSKKLGNYVQGVFSKLKNELISELPSKELFIENYKELSYGRSEKSRQLIKYSLEEINKIFSTAEHKLDFNQVNIEHILPQEPKKWNLTKKDVKGYVNKIGNLTLLSKRLNSKVGNEKINKKIEELEKSEIYITKKLVEKINTTNAWNEDLIRERQVELAEISYDKIWTIK